MTRVGSSDHLLLLLRERLQRLDRGGRRSSANGVSGQAAPGSPMTRLQALATVRQLPEEELRRGLVRALLAEELGEGVAEDPRFLTICDEVLRVLGDSEHGRALLQSASEGLRAEE